MCCTLCSTFLSPMSHLCRCLAFPFLPVRCVDHCHGICLLPCFAPGQMPSPAVPASSQHGGSVDSRPNTLWPAGICAVRSVIHSWFTLWFVCWGQITLLMYISDYTFSKPCRLYSWKRDRNNRFYWTGFRLKRAFWGLTAHQINWIWIWLQNEVSNKWKNILKQWWDYIILSCLHYFILKMVSLDVWLMNLSVQCVLPPK